MKVGKWKERVTPNTCNTTELILDNETEQEVKIKVRPNYETKYNRK